MTDAPTAVPPPELLAAFEAYERAIVANDLEALDAAFAPGRTTMRADAAGLLVGHDAISDFRGLRGGVPPREIVRLETRLLAPNVVLLVSVSRYRDGGQGVQTQIWEQIDDRWLITAAHVTGRAQAFDRSVWRTVGDPLSQGAWEGPLAGLTVAVKDLFAIRGYRIGAGNPTWLRERKREQATAPAVSDLLRGGASLRGIARTDEFAYSIAGANVHYGTPPNGALPGGLPGGSSNGPATAVAMGQADVGLASDTAGSIRVPASYQGLWGLRTTHGIVPRQGMLPLSQTFDTVGWLTRDGETLERVATWVLVTDSSADDPEADLTPAPPLPQRLVVPAEVLACTEDATRDAFQAWLERAAASDQVAGVDVIEIGDLSAYLGVFRTVQSAEAWRNNGAWVQAHPGAVGPDIAARLAAASQVTAEQERAAQVELGRMRQRLRTLTEHAVLALPTTPGPAPARTVAGSAIESVRAATLRMTSLAAIGGVPALSAPFLTVPSPLGPAPVGVCFVGPVERDLDLVRRARAIGAASAAGSVTGSAVPR